MCNSAYSLLSSSTDYNWRSKIQSAVGWIHRLFSVCSWLNPQIENQEYRGLAVYLLKKHACLYKWTCAVQTLLFKSQLNIEHLLIYSIWEALMPKIDIIFLLWGLYDKDHRNPELCLSIVNNINQWSEMQTS